MKLSISVLLTTMTVSSVTAFSQLPFSFSPSTTRLYISSWGAKGPPSRRVEEDPDPEKKIQSYLKAPEPVAARTNLDGTVLVSGWVNSKERTDETIFGFLNDEEAPFKFSKIAAFVDDVAFAKKRLISRKSRYSGLLDKLDFAEASEPGALPTASQLEGVKSWVVNIGSHVDKISQVAELVKTSSVENVALLVTDGQSVDTPKMKEAVSALQACGKTFTVVAVGSITESPEGQIPYKLTYADDITSDTLVPSNATYSRDESLRILSECLSLQSTSNKAIIFEEVKDVNATEYKLIKGLREGGYTRPQELDHMVVKGAAAYAKAIEDYKVRKPAATKMDAWLEQKQKELDESAAERKARIKAEYDAKKQQEIEAIATEWAKREYFRKATSGDMPYSEAEYIKSVWDRAMFEGDLKYRMLHGQATDERKELAEFKKKQEKKKAMMLERAKAELDGILNDEADDDDNSDDEDEDEDDDE